MARFDLPDLGEGLEDAEVVRWLVEVGDNVAIDQPIVEVETAKATVVIPSPYAGQVASVFAAAGEIVDVGAPLFSVDEDHTSSGDDPPVLVGYGRSAGPARRRPRVTPASTGEGWGAAVLAKPAIRKLAKDLGVDLAGIQGSGPGGSITRSDVETAAQPATDQSTDDLDDQAAGSRLTGTRRAIAAAMEKTLSIPDAAAWLTADASGLLEIRSDINDNSVTPFALAMRIVVAGLVRFPGLNARFTDDRLFESSEVHLGIATQTERGLLVPVIANAQTMGAIALGRQIASVAAQARAGSLTPSALSGSTFTATNYGAFGVHGGHPILNPPNIAILGLGLIANRPWVTDGGDIGIRPMIELTIVFDHRFNDGSTPSSFLRYVADVMADAAALREILEP